MKKRKGIFIFLFLVLISSLYFISAAGTCQNNPYLDCTKIPQVSSFCNKFNPYCAWSTSTNSCYTVNPTCYYLPYDLCIVSNIGCTWYGTIPCTSGACCINGQIATISQTCNSTAPTWTCTGQKIMMNYQTQYCDGVSTSCSGRTEPTSPTYEDCNKQNYYCTEGYTSNATFGCTLCQDTCSSKDYQCGSASFCGWGVNCGTCSLPNAVSTCSSGSCLISSCNSGYKDCDGNAVNGCETQLGTNTNCASCGNACSTGQTCTNNICVSCDLTSAYWSITNALQGQLVRLNIAGTNCDGKTITFKIFEKDGLLNSPDAITEYGGTNPSNIVFSGTNSYATWNAFYMSDTDGGQSNPPEYYFTASVSGTTKLIESSNSGDSDSALLTVNIPVTCPNGQCIGETCSTCPQDCGVCSPVCGNSKIEGTEQCDCGTAGCVSSELNGQTCASRLGIGYTGTLSCYAAGLPNQCTFNTALCITPCTNTCSSLGYQCGSVCGIICGTCVSPQTCQSNNLCGGGCIAISYTPALNTFCGTRNVIDNCGNTVSKTGTVPCNLPQTCQSNNLCGDGCTSNCIGKVCGDNGCGGSCGTCGTGYNCQTNGTCIKVGCTDTDNGRDYFTPGTTTDSLGLGEGIDSCSSDGKTLAEYYCSGNYKTSENYLCPNGCVKGACVSSNKTCTDTCSSLGYQCGIQSICGNSTNCGSCSTGFSCQTNNGTCMSTKNQTNLCTDSDGGKNYFVFGTTTDSLGLGEGIDSCSSDGKTLAEYYCSGNYKTSENYLCLNGCQEGACVSPEGCTDTCFSLNYECGVVCGADCGTCPIFQICTEGKCKLPSVPIIPIGENKKNMARYSNKEVFLISDKTWKDVLSLIPLTTWTGSENCNKGYGTPSNVCVYPTLIYHEENAGFDADSIIYFMQQYDAGKVTIIGETPKELDNLLIAQPELGAGISSGNIRRIHPADYLNYWSSYGDVVYVEDDYELALVASTYASLINAPLVIKGTDLDVDSIFSGRNLICVGQTSGRTCNEQYTLEQLQQKYVDKTNTDKIILVNADDLDMAVNTETILSYDSKLGTNYLEEVTTSLHAKKSLDVLYDNLYGKTSLVSPILASAKHELILNSKRAFPYYAGSGRRGGDSTLIGPSTIMAFYIHEYSRDLGMNAKYLTILAAPNAIENRKYVYTTIDDPIARGSQKEDIYIALDQNSYADYGGYFYTGRIMGLTLSDVSGYVARDLFYNSVSSTDNVLFMASSWAMNNLWDGMERIKRMVSEFSSAGYFAEQKMLYSSSFFDQDLWNKYDYNLIFYADHGNDNWAGIYEYSIPKLNNALVIGDACLTASTYDSHSFWAYVIRQGGIGYSGSVSVSMIMTGPVYLDFINGVYHGGTIGNTYYSSMSLGQAMGEAYKNKVFGGAQERWRYMVTLIGDPTLNINPPHRVGYIT